MFLKNLVKRFSTSVIYKEVYLERLTDHHEGIALLTLNDSKKRNAFSKHFTQAINDAMSQIENDQSIKVFILRSLIPNIFCAGADLKERLAASNDEVWNITRNLRATTNRLENLPMPTIAAIDGYALGGGLELALAADIRIISNLAKVGLVETGLGIMPGAGGTQRLPRLINPSVAKELIFTGRIIDGLKAKELGIVNESVEINENGNGAFLKSLELAEEILKKGPIGVRMAKQAINKGLQVDMDTANWVEGVCYSKVIPTKDRIEGLKAFKEKRPPKYIGC